MFHAEQKILLFGGGAAGDLSLPLEEVNQVLKAAHDHMLSINDLGNWLSIASTLTVWIAFASTSTITLIAGYYGKISEAGKPETVQTEGLPRKAVRMITFLAALGAVLTAFSHMAESASQKQFARADNLLLLIDDARNELTTAKSVFEERRILDKLTLSMKR